MGKTNEFKAVEKDAIIRGGTMVQVVDNVANGKGVDVALEVRYIGGVVGRKRMRVTDLATSPFNEGAGVLQHVL